MCSSDLGWNASARCSPAEEGGLSEDLGRREGKAPGFALPKRFSLRVGGIGRLGVLTPSPIGRLGEKVSEDLGRRGVRGIGRLGEKVSEDLGC